MAGVSIPVRTEFRTVSLAVSADVVPRANSWPVARRNTNGRVRDDSICNEKVSDDNFETFQEKPNLQRARLKGGQQGVGEEHKGYETFLVFTEATQLLENMFHVEFGQQHAEEGPQTGNKQTCQARSGHEENLQCSNHARKSIQFLLRLPSCARFGEHLPLLS